MWRSFWSWLSGGLSEWWASRRAGEDSVERRQDAIDKRQNTAFDQSIEFNAVVIAQFKDQGQQINQLRLENAEQAAQMTVMRQKLEECDRERKELAARVERLEAQLTKGNQ